MKKLYSLIVAAILAFGASAAAPELDLAIAGDLQFKTKMAQQKKHQSAKMFKAQKVNGAEALEGIRQGHASRSAADLEGEWIVTFGDYYFEESLGAIDVLFDVTAFENLMLFECIDTEIEILPFIAALDEQSGTVSIDLEYLAPVTVQGSQYYLYQQPFRFIYPTIPGEPGRLDFLNSITGQYKAATQTIEFDDDLGIEWDAYVDQAGTTLAGYLDVMDILSAYKYIEDDTMWENIGQAVFMDGWILPGFGVDQTNEDMWFEVPIQQNATNKNLYRLVDPFKGDHPAAGVNQSTKTGYIEFDVTDPDHVIFSGTEAGFAHSSAGITSFYPSNTLSTLAISTGMSVDDIVGFLKTDVPCTTYKDGVVTLGHITNSKGELLYDAVFGIQGQKNDGLYWQDEAGNQPNMDAKIIMPTSAIGSVVDDAKAEGKAEYFNLLGIRIQNPEPGQIVIKRQGNIVSKVIF